MKSVNVSVDTLTTAISNAIAKSIPIIADAVVEAVKDTFANEHNEEESQEEEEESAQTSDVSEEEEEELALHDEFLGAMTQPDSSLITEVYNKYKDVIDEEELDNAITTATEVAREYAIQHGSWQICKVDSKYEINTLYPYPIRKRSNQKVISVYRDNIKSSKKYMACKLSGIKKYFHVVVATIHTQ